MVIEVFYVPGCPNHQPAIASLRDVLRSATIDAPIHEIAVIDEAMASRLKFPGSPTIRIDGSDVESNHPESYGLACRLYSNGAGVPSREILERALAQSKGRKI
jgi:hypothetical protein